MKKIVLSIVAVSSLAFATHIQLQEGWQLLGTSNPIVDMKVFNKSSIQTVWTFDKNMKIWKAYSPNMNLQAIINQAFTPLISINSNEGFWVNVNQGFSDILVLDENVTDTNNTIATSRYVDPLLSVTLSHLAGKTFKYIENHMHDTSSTSQELKYKTLVFNDDGVAIDVLTYNSCDYNDTNNTSTTITIKVENDNLNFYAEDNTAIAKSYKILAYDDSGIVFGQLNTATSYTYSTLGLPGEIFYFLNENISASPTDMSTKIPFAMYQTWNSSSYSTYESNGTMMGHNVYNGIDNSYYHQDYLVVNGAITTSSISEGQDYNSSWTTTLQDIYTIGRYNISTMHSEGSYWNSIVKYYDTNNTSYDLNLSANPTIDTWQEIFAVTGNRLNSTYYYEANNTTSYGEIYTISEDGKSLTTTTPYDCYSRIETIDSNAIMSQHLENWAEINSQSPIVNDSYTTQTNRPLNEQKFQSFEEIQNNIKSRISQSSWVK